MSEFKKFIMRGNVIDLAVGVIIGSAFTTIVNSIVKDIFMPLIGVITGGLDFSSLSVTLVGEAKINFGSFISALISFIIVAFVLFSIIKLMNSVQKKPETVVKRKCPFCRNDVADEAVRCPFCTSDISQTAVIETCE